MGKRGPSFLAKQQNSPDIRTIAMLHNPTGTHITSQAGLLNCVLHEQALPFYAASHAKQQTISNDGCLHTAIHSAHFDTADSADRATRSAPFRQPPKTGFGHFGPAYMYRVISIITLGMTEWNILNKHLCKVWSIQSCPM